MQIYRMEFYRVKKGQKLCDVSKAFGVPSRLLAFCNGLKGEIREGQILRLPPLSGNLYTVRGGESKTLLCGTAEAFEEKNGTKHLYPTQTIFL